MPWEILKKKKCIVYHAKRQVRLVTFMSQILLDFSKRRQCSKKRETFSAIFSDLFSKRNYRGIVYTLEYIVIYKAITTINCWKAICLILWHTTRYTFYSIIIMLQLIPMSSPWLYRTVFGKILISKPNQRKKNQLKYL